EVVLDKEALRIICEAFMNPHVRRVFHRDVIAKPFMRRFMDDNKVEFETDAGTAHISIEIAVAKPVAVRNRALMLHPWVRNSDEFVTVFVKGILAEPMFEGFHHAGNFLELPDRSIFLMSQHPIVHVEHPAFSLILFGKVHIVADVNVHSLVIDRIADFPMKGLCFITGIVVCFCQTTVRNRRYIFRHSYVDVESAVRFIVPMVFIRPPNTCSDPLASGVNEILSEVISAPAYSANPGRVSTYNRDAFITYFNLIFDIFWDIFLKRYPIDIPLTLKFQLRVTMSDLGDCKRWLQINLHFVSSF